ncbi:hypothetical protein CYLTODRAFT_441166 [Cylindrobasidium torrendii FP15055 ss-10]|uniref:Uncharacterized protein n=1 Tax=Cylindrobasidium torrendii FP15055 ss-10 TaxID=1314674 RepID=A0A0D7BMQ4_9AGAR|nr:hypothetical protein CYLTODRAFT_441166 [Cylindrobasidium torrendii FP15055 ss-10]
MPLCALPESGTILRSVIMLCAPAEIEAQNLLPALYDGTKLQNALDKYKMEKPSRRLTELFEAYSKSLVETEPLRAFSIADAFNTDDVLLEAARHLLKSPVLSWPLSIPELGIASATRYHQLVRYFQRSTVAATAVLGDWAAEDDAYSGGCSIQGCSAPTNITAPILILQLKGVNKKSYIHSRYPANHVTKGELNEILARAPGGDIFESAKKVLMDASECVCNGSLRSREIFVDECVKDFAFQVGEALSTVSFHES